MFIIKQVMILCIILGLNITSGYANEKDPTSKGVCHAAINVFERLHKIPKGLLHAIASTESTSNPWAVNREGKAFYFDTQDQATKFVKDSMSSGYKSIDVGCMQVNLLYHGSNFKTLDEAFHPINNINYAAIFLKQLYQETGSWKKAIKYYHSRDQKFNQKYLAKVMNIWAMVSL
ncbi:Transglycosylase SLT domain protein [Candidatus Arcanobacter lacustris]|uniref:Transglycosylase SLT domain protein n=1 Tax=Candidatus Arcanibacter lacustris TaxID=1607817 RepID=A0A0F5MP32_9RICK|nr:Transglycosylase SLT domain protein [Candidatus Arcanobacter lacustris]